MNCNQPYNDEIVAKVKRFLRDGCGCCAQCSKRFAEESVLANLFSCLELTRRELDLVNPGNVQALMEVTAAGEKRRRSPRCNFLFNACPISKEMFFILYGISYSRFRRLKDHYEQHSISQRIHGSTKRLPHNTLPQAVAEDVKNLLDNYVEENAILLLGTIPGYKSDDIKLL